MSPQQLGQVLHNQGQVLQFPQQYAAPPAPAATTWLPAFPSIASLIDGYAVKLPWYLWAAAGFYFAYRLIKN